MSRKYLLYSQGGDGKMTFIYGFILGIVFTAFIADVAAIGREK
jgi:hypothetical protein